MLRCGSVIGFDDVPMAELATPSLAEWPTDEGTLQLVFGAVRMRHTVWILLMGATIFGSQLPSAAAKDIPLHDGWSLQSACKVSDPATTISSPEYRPTGWLTVSVPTTVLAAQVAAGVYKDVYFGMNLRSIPGASYPIGENSSNLPMPADSPYHCGWWYRKRFDLPAAEPGGRFALQFDGINYSADVWVNGVRIADQSQVRGTYRTYEFDVTQAVRTGTKNVVAVQVFAPTEKDLGMNWVDWNPMPPDKNMGLWSDVRLVTGGPVAVRHTAVLTHFEDDNLQTALLTVTADLRNGSARAYRARWLPTLLAVVSHSRSTFRLAKRSPLPFARKIFPS